MPKPKFKYGKMKKSWLLLVALIIAFVATLATYNAEPLVGLSYAGKGWPIIWRSAHGTGAGPYSVVLYFVNLPAFLVDMAFWYIIAFVILLLFHYLASHN